IKGHQKRAKAVLKRTWPDIAALDSSKEFRIRGDKWQMRSLILLFLHVAVIWAALYVFWHPPQSHTQTQSGGVTTQQPSNQSTAQPTALPPQQPTKGKP